MTSRRGFLRNAGIALAAAPLLPALRAAGSGIDAADAGTVPVQRYCMTMGAIAGIRIYGRDRHFCEEAIDAAFAEMRMVDRLMSAFDRRSPLSAVNRSAGREDVAVPRDLVAAVQSARAYHLATGGAFDVTVGPLMGLYGFMEPGEARTLPCPDDRAIAAALEAVGFANVRIDPACMCIGLAHPSSRIDLGGIGVGLALDRAASALRSRGVESGLINHSGDILAIGAPPGSPGWEIGIQDPGDPRGTIASFTLRDRSLSTSGNYENFVETGCGRVGHIFDPASGRAPSRYLSVSVFAGSSLAADALSTGFFAGGVRLADSLPNGIGAVSVFTVCAEEAASGRSRAVTEFIPVVSPRAPNGR